jgi:hypothetical protein
MWLNHAKNGEMRRQKINAVTQIIVETQAIISKTRIAFKSLCKLMKSPLAPLIHSQENQY